MRKTIGAILGAAAMLTLPFAAEARPRQHPEARLAKILAGRVAGEPVNCIYTPSIRDTRIIDRTAILYDAGSVIYVNRPDTGASSLDDDDVMVTERTSPSLCQIDIVRMHDRSSFFFTGFVSLGDFVPYRKVQVRN